MTRFWWDKQQRDENDDPLLQRENREPLQLWLDDMAHYPILYYYRVCGVLHEGNVSTSECLHEYYSSVLYILKIKDRIVVGSWKDVVIRLLAALSMWPQLQANKMAWRQHLVLLLMTFLHTLTPHQTLKKYHLYFSTVCVWLERNDVACIFLFATDRWTRTIASISSWSC
jgi:hypothetical protein